MRPQLAIVTLICLAAIATAEAPHLSASPPDPADPVEQVAAGWGHTCVLTASGKVYCWGAAEINGSDRNSSSPVLVTGLNKVKAISAGLVASCAVDATDRAWCWGTDWKQTVERNEVVRTHVPILVEGLPEVTQIVVGYAHWCAILKSDGSIWCWGGNAAGELGNGTTEDQVKPVRAGNITRATSISAGVGNTCAVANGEIYCWGTDHREGGRIVKSKIPVKVRGPEDVIKVVNGRNFFCALTQTGEVTCFGSNIFLQLGNAAVGKGYSIPVRTKVPPANDIAANLFSACASLVNKKVYCWGSPLRKAGDGAEPAETIGVDNAKKIALGLGHGCVVLYSGRVKCWGDNEAGNLGNGNNLQVDDPVEVIGLP
jgi:alpha-tubulin suppressor-like RCC1 family protein